MKDGWVEAPKDIECVDIWPPGRLTNVERDAYDRLAKAGRIVPTSVKRDPAGRVYVRYFADCPQEWIRQELKQAKLLDRQLEVEMK